MVQAFSTGTSYKYNLMQTLVVINDNLFENIYIMNLKNQNGCTNIKYYKSMWY
jgi:hypothetical protein